MGKVRVTKSQVFCSVFTSSATWDLLRSSTARAALRAEDYELIGNHRSSVTAFLPY